MCYTTNQTLHRKEKMEERQMIKQFEIPDVRDGLTTLQRRILWTMKTMGLTSKKPYKKAINISRYHFIRLEFIKYLFNKQVEGFTIK